MGSQELLVMAMALPPMCVAARMWWSMRHAAAELGDFRVVVPGAGDSVRGRDDDDRARFRWH